jgi:capsular polysaccharide biosynthesis protein
MRGQEEVLEELERRLQARGLGLKVFHGGSTGLRETIDLFSRAEAIVGAHGAGLANMVGPSSPWYCPREFTTQHAQVSLCPSRR